MTERYLAGLKVYQDNGYFTDIVVESLFARIILH